VQTGESVVDHFGGGLAGLTLRGLSLPGLVLPNLGSDVGGVIHAELALPRLALEVFTRLPGLALPGLKLSGLGLNVGLVG
jgi:hypothetical protein